MTDTAQSTRPSFGFGALDDIQPGRLSKGRDEPRAPEVTRSKAPPKPRAASARPVPSGRPSTGTNRAADEAAAKLGFGSREPLVRRRKRQPIEEPVEQINLRAAVADINVFIEWCENNRYSYREGFAELVKHIDAKAA